MIKDILKEFDEKNFKIYDTYNNDFRSINDDPLSDEIKQFLSDKIKEAMESMKLKKREQVDNTWENEYVIQRIIGYNFAVDEMNNNIKEFYEE